MKKILSIVALFILVLSASNNAGLNQGIADVIAIPHEQGEVVFSCNQKSPSQLYIIGVGHRDTLTRANGNDTVNSQMEVYRIGEWLIQQEGLELLLLEGFFFSEAVDEKKDSSKIAASAAPGTKSLVEKLENDAEVNAGMLLIENYRLDKHQVEDWDLYDDVRNKVRMLAKYRDDDFEYLYMKASLDYLQERRTAAMLQKMPDLIDSEHRAGRIKNKKAIFTVGISHISGIIKHLKQQRIEIYSPAFTSYEDYVSGIKLLEKDFGVTIIIPKTLANNKELLRLFRLADAY